ncbi:MAG: hypothetical protein ABIK68_14625 [bacterium]
MMASVKPPRSAFLDFPLGHPCGKPHDVPLQKSIIKDVLDFLVTAERPGEIRDLAYAWGRPFGWSDFMQDLQAMIEAEGAPLQNWKPKD